MTDELNKIRKKVKNALNADRYEHTIGVMHTAACLAMRYGVSQEAALTAGLLHDCAKCIPNDEKLSMCQKAHIQISDAERKNPSLLHAKLGAYLAEKQYGIKDKAILRAIEAHTTGKPAMSLLDKIIYIADFIEPNRSEAPNLPEVRALAFTDLDACLYKILEDSLVYLQSRKLAIDPATEETYNFYKQLREIDRKANEY